MTKINLLLFFLVFFAVSSYAATNPYKTLLITDLSVVNSKEAYQNWSLIKVLSLIKKSNQLTSEFLKDWLNQWEIISSINNKPITPLDPKTLLRFWPLTTRNTLDFNQSPFLLSAVVYRPDLIDVNQGGEFRLIYSGYDEQSQMPLQITIIAEFIIPKAFEQNIKDRFISLSSIDYGKDFNQKINEIFTLIVNSQNLGQIRVNDFILNDSWDLREFKLLNDSLKMTTTAFTPQLNMNNEDSFELKTLVENNRSSILKGNYKLPKNFWGGTALMPSEDFIWFENDSMDTALKTSFSVMTCNGCHSGATHSRFVHLEPRVKSLPAEPSNYLKEQLTIRLKYLEDFSYRRHPYAH
jgi:hypothetical protein